MAENILSNFERFDRDGLELVVDTATGKAYASIRATARMCEVEASTISRWIGVAKMPTTKAEIQTASGVQGVALLSSEDIFEAALKYNPSLARKMGTAGANVYMLGLAGYSIEVKEPKPKTALELAREKVILAQENVALAQENVALLEKIEQQAPLVEYATAVQHSEDSIEFNEFAKMIGTGRTRLFRAMREAGVIMKNSSLPYQQWCDAGYFEVSQEVTQNGIEDKLIPFALVTGKGQIWLRDRLVKSAQNQARIAGAIARDVMRMSIL